MSKTPVYIQQTSTFNAVNNVSTNDLQLRMQLSSIITDLTNIIKRLISMNDKYQHWYRGRHEDR